MRVWTVLVMSLVGLASVACGGGEEAEQPEATVEVADTDTAVAWRTNDAGLLVRTSRPVSFSVHVVELEAGEIQQLQDAEGALAERVLAGL